MAQAPQHERLCFDPELKMLSKATAQGSLKLKFGGSGGKSAG
jgi:hypothetical protein